MVTGAVTVAVTVAAVAAGVTVGAAASAVADAVLYPWRAAKGLAGALTTDGAGVGLTCEARTGDGCMAGHYSSADALTRIPSPLRPPHTGRVMGQGAAGRPAVAASRGLEGQQGSGYTREEPLLELHAALGHVRASEADLRGRTGRRLTGCFRRGFFAFLLQAARRRGSWPFGTSLGLAGAAASRTAGWRGMGHGRVSASILTAG